MAGFFISFRDKATNSPFKNDWVAWIGTYEDLKNGRDGELKIRLMHDYADGDCAYPAVEILPDGTVVATSYGHWDSREKPVAYVVCIRLNPDTYK